MRTYEKCHNLAFQTITLSCCRAIYFSIWTVVLCHPSHSSSSNLNYPLSVWFTSDPLELTLLMFWWFVQPEHLDWDAPAAIPFASHSKPPPNLFSHQSHQRSHVMILLVSRLSKINQCTICIWQKNRFGLALWTGPTTMILIHMPSPLIYYFEQIKSSLCK